MRIFEQHTWRWLKAILSVFALTMVSSSILCGYLLQALEKNIIETNSSIKSFVKMNTDSRLEELHHYTLAIEIGHANIEQKNYYEMPSTLSMATYQMSSTLKDFVATNSLASGIYVYYPRSKLVVGNLGCYTAESYYVLQAMPYRTGYDEWIESLEADHEGYFACIKSQNGDKFCYIRSSFYAEELTSVFVIEIDSSKLLQTYAPADADVGHTSMGFFLDGELITYEGGDANTIPISKLYQEWVTTGKAQFKENGIFVFFNHSDFTGLDYFNIYEANQLLQPLTIAIFVCVIVSSLCVVIGVSGSIAISKKNANLFNRLLKSLGAGQNIDKDEYQFVSEKVQQLMVDKYQTERQMREHESMLNALFLNTILCENTYKENDVFLCAKSHGISFDHTNFQVIVLQSPLSEYLDSVKLDEMVHMVMEDFDGEILSTVYDQRYVILFNTEVPCSLELIQSSAKSLMDVLFLQTPACAGIGAVFDNMASITTSYHNALIVLQYIEPDIVHSYLIYSIEFVRRWEPAIIQEFSKAIIDENYSQAEIMIDRLFLEYIQIQDSEPVKRMRLQTLFNLFSDAFERKLTPKQARLETQKLVACQDNKLLEKRVHAALAKLIKITESGSEVKNPVVERAKKMIELNYSDPMMGLYLLSEHFNVSNSYLSTAFKNKYQIGIIQYINQLRIERAKELILSTEMNIKEIAETVGFASDVNFIRVFKKSENQTPTMLRKQRNKPNQ